MGEGAGSSSSKRDFPITSPFRLFPPSLAAICVDLVRTPSLLADCLRSGVFFVFAFYRL